jgi:hypothetical protein
MLTKCGVGNSECGTNRHLTPTLSPIEAERVKNFEADYPGWRLRGSLTAGLISATRFGVVSRAQAEACGYKGDESAMRGR